MRDLNELQYFAWVAEHGGYAAASRATGVPKATLSRRVAALEARLNVQLLHRGSRLFRLTEHGQAYVQHCQAMLIEADAADAQIAQLQVEPQGTLRLSCPPALMNSEFAELLAAFMAAYPRVNVQVEVSNRMVDVQREGLDVAIRVRFPPLADSDLVVRHLAWSSQRWLVAPVQREAAQQALASCFAADGSVQPSDLASLHLGDGQAQWHLLGPDDRALTITHQPKLMANDMSTLYHAALQGVGVAALPLVMAREAMREGRLVEVMPGWQPRPGLLHLAFPSRRGLLPSVRLFIDFCVQAFAQPERLARGYEAIH